MKNNDVLTGEILKVQRGELYFDGDIAGEVTIDLKDITGLEGRKNIYRAKVIKKGLYLGEIAEAAEAGYFSIIHANDTMVFSISDITWLRRYKKNTFLHQFEGAFNIGYTYTKGSGFKPITISDQLLYTLEKWQVYQGFSGIYPAAEGGGFERMDANIGLRHLINRQWMAITHLEYQRILQLGVKARMLNITGITRRLIENRHLLLDVGTGIALQKEHAVKGGTSRRQLELPAIIDFHLFQLDRPDLDISANAHLFYNLSVARRFRADYSANISYEIVSDFIISMQFYYNYDSRPFIYSSSRSDFGNVFTIGYSF